MKPCNGFRPSYFPYPQSRYVGIEYELLLREKLMNLGVTFKDESELREMGYKRTPDIKLDVPMQVCGQTVRFGCFS